MMPNLPTDSLYKFIFIGSLFLISLIGYYLVSKKEKLVSSYNTYKLESIHLGFNYSKLVSEYKNIEKKISTQSRNTDELINQYELEYNSLVKADTLLRLELEKLDNEIKNFNSNSWILISVIGILILMAIVSCCFWYCKLQRFQDTIIKNQAIKHEN